jgi:hypothetical protein
MRFIATWRHSDGSVVELSERGWKSQDTEKSDWLTTMSDRRSTGFAIPSVIKVWLEENCQLLDVRGSPDQLINISSLLQPVTDIEQPDAGGGGNEETWSLPFIEEVFAISEATDSAATHSSARQNRRIERSVPANSVAPILLIYH